MTTIGGNPQAQVVQGDDDPRREADLQRMYATLDQLNIKGRWLLRDTALPDTPSAQSVPWLWQWDAVRELALESSRLIPVDRGGDRRVLGFINPGNQELGATRTLWAGVQVLNPHESAPAHRHSPSALRFFLEGDGAYTTVDGVRCDMSPGDLILTPAWKWHDHYNEGSEPVFWFDGLDTPMVRYLAASFFEEYPEYTQQVGAERNASRSTFGHVGILPATQVGTQTSSPLYIYPWEASDRALAELVRTTAADPVLGYCIRFVNPTTGDSVMPTIDAELTRLPDGLRTEAAREVCSRVFVVVRGHGRSIIDGTEFAWSRGDTFVAPSWSCVEHESIGEDATLFSYSDRPALKALHLWRQAALPERHQEVTGSFASPPVS